MFVFKKVLLRKRVDVGKLVNIVVKCYCFGYSIVIIMLLIIENCNNNMFIFCFYGNIGIIKSWYKFLFYSLNCNFISS